MRAGFILESASCGTSEMNDLNRTVVHVSASALARSKETGLEVAIKIPTSWILISPKTLISKIVMLHGLGICRCIAIAIGHIRYSGKVVPTLTPIHQHLGISLSILLAGHSLCCGW